MRVTVMEVSINSFNKNISTIKKFVGSKKIIPILKANAYGTYINRRLDVINQFDIVAVAIVDEAIELRNLGYEKEIFLLNQPSILEIDDIVKYNITIGLSSIEFLNEVIKQNKKIKVHLEIETGMNRTGVKLFDVDKFVQKIKENNNIIIDGVYTHFSSADSDFEYTKSQIEIFKKAVKIIKENFDVTFVHSSASSGILNFDDGISNAVRPGIIMYGFLSFDGSNKILKTEPICKLKSRITFLKELNKNESIGYGRSFITKNKMLVATVPIGYADGLKRNLSNLLEVIVNGAKTRIVGNICMDSMMIDVTNIDNVKVGDSVYIGEAI